jgi:hypothetical protein
MKNAPQRIFLNLGPNPDRNDFASHHQVTWSTTRIDKHDLEYKFVKKEKERPVDQKQIRNRFYNIVRHIFDNTYGPRKPISDQMKELSEISELEFSSYRGVGRNIIDVAILELEKYGLTFKPLEKVKERIGGVKHGTTDTVSPESPSFVIP